MSGRRPGLTPARRRALAELLAWDGGSCVRSNQTSAVGGLVHWKPTQWLIANGYARATSRGPAGDWVEITDAGRELAIADGLAVERGQRRPAA